MRVLAEETGENEPILVNIVTALRDVSAELRPTDLFLFFFAGHGVERDRRSYLLTRKSCHGLFEHGSLALEELRNTLERIGAGRASCSWTHVATDRMPGAVTQRTAWATLFHGTSLPRRELD